MNIENTAKAQSAPMSVQESLVQFHGEIDPATKDIVLKLVRDASEIIKMIEANQNFARFAKDRAISAISANVYHTLIDLGQGGYSHADAINRATTSDELEEAYSKRWDSHELIWDHSVEEILGGISSRRKPQ